MSSPHAQVTSKWWYVVAAGTVYGVVAAAVFVAMVPFLFALVLGTGPSDPALAFGLTATTLALVAVPLALLGTALAIAFPLAIYLDAEAVADADLDWSPDPVLYGVVGVVGLFAGGTPIQPAVGVYYLYRRHQHVGRP
jgi:hypothetical protein